MYEKFKFVQGCQGRTDNRVFVAWDLVFRSDSLVAIFTSYWGVWVQLSLNINFTTSLMNLKCWKTVKKTSKTINLIRGLW